MDSPKENDTVIADSASGLIAYHQCPDYPDQHWQFTE